jgi:hypothetical protein
VLAEIGYADALLARELPDGTLELIDGHLRAETTPDVEVPVLVLDVDENEAAKLLAIHDPLAAMAGTNEEVLSDLLAHVQTENQAVQTLLDQLLEGGTGLTNGTATGQRPEESAEGGAGLASGTPAPPLVDIPEAFQVVVECQNEDQQRAVFERMTAEGYKCRLLTL